MALAIWTIGTPPPQPVTARARITMARSLHDRSPDPLQMPRHPRQVAHLRNLPRPHAGQDPVAGTDARRARLALRRPSLRRFHAPERRPRLCRHAFADVAGARLSHARTLTGARYASSSRAGAWGRDRAGTPGVICLAEATSGGRSAVRARRRRDHHHPAPAGTPRAGPCHRPQRADDATLVQPGSLASVARTHRGRVRRLTVALVRWPAASPASCQPTARHRFPGRGAPCAHSRPARRTPRGRRVRTPG
jgi:hypothetical protein